MGIDDSAFRTSDQPRIAVIGGGISGLAAAHRLIEVSPESRVTLFEASPALGGVFGTEHRDGYLVERGADSFITNKPWAVRLCERLGLADELIPTDDTHRRSLVLRKGKPVPVPEGFMLLSPAKVWPVLTSPIFSPWGKLRMGWEYFVRRRSSNGDESLASFVRRRFGSEALDRLVQPLVGGIYTSDPEKLSLRATMPRFLDMERDHRSLIRASRKQVAESSKAETEGSGARYGLFATLRNGLSQLIEKLEERITASADIRRNTPVRQIIPTDDGWRIELADGSTETFDAVIPAVRAYQVADLIAGFDADLADDLRGIEYASSAVVVSGHKLADIQHPLDAFGLVIPAIENRKILAVSFSSRKFPDRAPDGRVLLRTFVGGAMQPELLERDDDAIVDLVQSELRDILGVAGEPDFTKVARYKNAMPQYHVGHLDRIAGIEKRVAKHPGLMLAGNAYHGVGLPDCIHSGETAAERLLKQENNPAKV